jgi:predicted XRE-type DNA-binding protein
MTRVTPIITRTAAELAVALGLPKSEGVKICVRSALTAKIIEVATKRGDTHAEIAALAGTSRARVTAILNGNTQAVSTDLLLQVLGALGMGVRLTFRRAA